MKRPTKAIAIERIQKALDVIPALNQKPYDSHDFKKWRRDTRLALENIFAAKSDRVKEFTQITFSPSGLFSGRSSEGYIRASQQSYRHGLKSTSALLESIIDEIKEYWTDEDNEPTPITQDGQDPTTNKVFVVHGRDEGTRNTVVGFLKKIGLQPIVLAEQPNRGFTTIEKFERHAQVSFAVVLLTPDDTGSLQGEAHRPKPRARQNVIFELGFFFGKLGRKRVCALTKDEVEIPSDYAGVVYIPFDDHEGWKLPLIRELRAAGFNVDANQAI